MSNNGKVSQIVAHCQLVQQELCKIGTLVFPATWQFRVLPDNSSICWYPAEFWRTQEISRGILEIPEITQNKSSWAEL